MLCADERPTWARPTYRVAFGQLISWEHRFAFGEWAASNGFQIGSDGTIPGPAITAYNQTHPDRPY
jgi:hypothetical protein